MAVQRSNQHKGQQRHRQRTRQVEQHIGDGPNNAPVLQQINHFEREGREGSQPAAKAGSD